MPPGLSEDGAELDDWESLGDMNDEELDEPFEEEGLAGDIRAVMEDELEVTELVEEDIAEAGLEVEQDEREIDAGDVAGIIDEALAEE